MGQKPVGVIADRGYDSDTLRKELVRRASELIAQQWKDWCKPRTQDEHALRQYRRRWTVECTFA